jgi:acetyl-CoA acyltransferase 1
MTSPAAQRLNQLTSQLTPQSAKERILQQSPDDIVITLAMRTPLTKARKGLLKDTPYDALLTSLLTSLRERLNFDPALVDDVCIGNVLSPAPGFGARSAVLAAGFPVSTSANIASRFCSSGLLSIQNVATAIGAGAIDVGIAVGVESMSLNADKPPEMSEVIMRHDVAKDNVMPMGWTSENVAKEFGVTRERQDEVAARSQQRAERAQKEGWTRDEIISVKTRVRDAKSGQWKDVEVSKDDGVRPGTTKEGLGKIKAAFPQWEPATTTGGNASQITDGAAGVVLMRRSKAQELGLKVLGKYVLSTTIGLEPRIMGIGPSFAIPKVLERVGGLKKEDVDLFEINEAFASMYVYCVEKLGLDPDKVNVRGGAIALGHPLGCTGTRQLVTLLSELRRTGGKIGVTSMCVGTGKSSLLFLSHPIDISRADQHCFRYGDGRCIRLRMNALNPSSISNRLVGLPQSLLLVLLLRSLLHSHLVLTNPNSSEILTTQKQVMSASSDPGNHDHGQPNQEKKQDELTAIALRFASGSIGFPSTLYVASSLK